MGKAMDSLMDLGNAAMSKIQADRKQKRKEGDDLASSILELGSGMGENYLNAATDYVDGLHGDYDKAAKWGNKKKQGEGMTDLNSFSGQTAAAKDLITSIAEAQKPSDGSASSWSASVSPKEQSVFNAVMSKDAKIEVIKEGKDKGKYRVHVGDKTMGDNGWMLMNDVDRMYQEHQKDYTTMVDVRDQIIKSKEAGAKRSAMGPHLDPDFDFDQTVNQMESTLRNGNLKSLIHDDVLENGKPWVEAVKEHPDITGLSYESLGIDPSMNSQLGAYRNVEGGMNTVDIDGDGKISEKELTLLSPQDRELITDALTNPQNDLYDEDRTRNMMANYFAQTIQTNYDKGYASNAKSAAMPDYNTLSDEEKALRREEYKKGII